MRTPVAAELAVAPEPAQQVPRLHPVGLRRPGEPGRSAPAVLRSDMRIVSLALLACGLVLSSTDRLVPAGQQRAPQALLDPFNTLTLERTQCYGTCPMYRIVVHYDGLVEYTGTRFVKTHGTASSRLTSVQIRELVEAVNDVEYFSLEDAYGFEGGGCPTNVTDMPTVVTSVTTDERTKTIQHNLGCREESASGLGAVYPSVLAEFEAKIDGIVGTEQWIGTRDEREQLRRGGATAPN